MMTSPNFGLSTCEVILFVDGMRVTCRTKSPSVLDPRSVERFAKLLIQRKHAVCHRRPAMPSTKVFGRTPSYTKVRPASREERASRSPRSRWPPSTLLPARRVSELLSPQG